MQESLNYLNPNYVIKTYAGRNQMWTPSAIDCYERGCNCKDCNIPHPESEACRMKDTVLALVKTIGKPEDNISYYEQQIRRQDELVKQAKEGIKEGKLVKDIAVELNIKYWYLLHILHKNGVYAYRQGEKRKCKL